MDNLEATGYSGLVMGLRYHEPDYADFGVLLGLRLPIVDQVAIRLFQSGSDHNSC